MSTTKKVSTAARNRTRKRSAATAAKVQAKTTRAAGDLRKAQKLARSHAPRKRAHVSASNRRTQARRDTR